MGLEPGAPCMGRPGGAIGAATRCGGAVYTGRGPVCGVIILLCGTIGWPGTGLACGGTEVACVLPAATGGAAGAFGCAAGGTTIAPGACTGGVTTTAGGPAGFSIGGGATTTGATGLTWGGVTTTLLSAAGAAGLGVTTVVCSTAGGAVGVGAFTGAAGATGWAVTAGGLAGGAGGYCCSCSLCLSSFITSPGLEILERSIFGLTSVADDLSRDDELDRADKCFRTRSASSSSIELEWVFF